MKANRLLGALLTAALSLAAVTQAADVHAQKGKKASAPTEAPMTQKAIVVTVAGIGWGQSSNGVALAIDRILDDDYRPLYREVQPGVKMKALDAQLAEDKSQFRRSKIEFGKLPTGVDATPLRGEFTYNNREALMTFTRKGEVTHFFFIQDRLWKLIEERKLNDASPIGKNYPDAVVKMSTKFGIAGRVQAPEGARFAVEVDWRDATTHLRAIQRSDTAVGLAYEDNATLASLGSLRPNKASDDNGIDPSVAGIIGGPKAPEGPPEKKDEKKKR